MHYDVPALHNPAIPKHRTTAHKQPACSRTVTASGVMDTAYDTYLTVPTDRVLVIDRLSIQAAIEDADINRFVRMSVDGASDAVFNFVGAATETAAGGWADSINIPINGGAFIGPGKTLRMQVSNAALLASASVYGHLMHPADAGRIGWSQQWVAGTTPGNFFISTPTNLANGVRTAVIAGITGYSIEIRGMWFTGSTLTTATESLLMEFSNGATHRKISRAFNAAGTSTSFALYRLNHGSGAMRIRGPSGYGVHATAVGAGAASGNLMCAFWGTYVKDQETLDGTGVPNTTGAFSKYFWYYDETVTAASTTRLVPAQNPACIYVVDGYMSSGIGNAVSGGNICLTNQLNPIGPSLILPSVGSAALVVDNIALHTDSADVLSTGRPAGAPTGLAQTVWGRILPRDGHYYDDAVLLSGS